MDKLLYVSEVAERLNCSKPTVYKLVSEGDLKGIKISENGLRIPEDSLEDFLARNVVVPTEKSEAI
jgi:excisionase family DNA binding protein